MDKFCGKCGAQIDKKTGLCPNCDAEALSKVTEKSNQKAVKNAKRKGVTAIIASVLVVVLVVTGVIFANQKGWFSNNDDEKKAEVKTTYISYLNKKIIPDIGTYDSQHPETSNEGVHSALMCDLNDDDTDEFVVAYSKSENSKISFNISCYEYNEDAAQAVNTETETAGSSEDAAQTANTESEAEETAADTAQTANTESEAEETAADTAQTANTESEAEESADEAVELTGTVTPFSEDDYTDETSDVYHIPNATFVYSIEYNGKLYIVCEHITWMDTYSYECHIYTLENGRFIEAGNLFVPDIGTVGIRIVYSSKLPDGLEIDNSTFDYSKAESSGVTENDGNFVLYFSEGGMSDYVYNDYYDSEDEAVSDYLGYFGIDKTSAVTYDDIPRLVCPDGASEIFSYVYYWEYNDDGDTVDKYEINDYTDIESLIEENTSDESTSVSETSTIPSYTDEDYALFEKMINDSAWVWNNNDFNENTSIEEAMNYIILDAVPNGLYTAFYGNLPDNYWENDDPQNKFGGFCYVLEADKVDWILQNVLGIQPDRTVENDAFYYEGDKLYKSLELGGGLDTIYQLEDYKVFDDGTVGFEMMWHYDDDNWKEHEGYYGYRYFIAELKDDDEVGKYWEIDEISSDSNILDREKR